MMTKIISSLRSLYKSYPASYSAIELFLLFGLYFFYMWITSFWFWGVYRLHIQVPNPIERFFFYLWHMSPYLVLPSVVVGLLLVVLTFFIRKDPLKELGIRLDNFKASGKECLIVFIIGLGFIILFFVFHVGDFKPRAPHNYLLILTYPLWGIAQQFVLQSIIFVRLFQILKNNNLTIASAAIIFSLLHAPNIPLMVLALLAGGCCCVLFSRHRNIFVVGTLHGVSAALVYSLLVPGVITDYKTGPIPKFSRNYTEFIAYLRYKGNPIVAKPSSIITIPVEIENKSTTSWDSSEKKHPVYISYHLSDAQGNLLVFDNVRTSLPHPIRPGESLRVDLTIAAPPDTGQYQLEIDMVKERVAWFKNKGSLTIHIPLVVIHGDNKPSGKILDANKESS